MKNKILRDVQSHGVLINKMKRSSSTSSQPITLKWDFVGSSVVPSGKRNQDGSFELFGTILWYNCKVNGILCIRETMRLNRNVSVLNTYFVQGVCQKLHSEDELILKITKPHLNVAEGV